MLDYPCRVLVVEDDPEDIELIKNMLADARSSYFQRGFELAYAETLAEAKEILSRENFDVILLDLMLPDSHNMDGLEELQAATESATIIVQTALEDEVVAVKALELGACGYLPKVASDRNLLLYAIRSAIDRQQQLINAKPLQQHLQELDNLENLIANSSESQQDGSLFQKMPDLFGELEVRYQQLLDRFVEQKIYQVEYELAVEINVLIQQLGYLQATPRDLVELHTAVLKQKQSVSPKGAKAFIIEGRYLLLELMGKLAAYYRRYYIGLSKLNLANAQNYRNLSSWS